ncbi:MAG: hypothetical protein MK097_11615, partial [Dechloromonas sp.]|nr:hypothetical protein [Dechloromonas sp.]
MIHVNNPPPKIAESVATILPTSFQSTAYLAVASLLAHLKTALRKAPRAPELRLRENGHAYHLGKQAG